MLKQKHYHDEESDDDLSESSIVLVCFFDGVVNNFIGCVATHTVDIFHGRPVKDIWRIQDTNSL